jgi:hypothetical protein
MLTHRGGCHCGRVRFEVDAAVCGIKSFYVPRSHPDGYSVNVRCLDEGTVEAVTVHAIDGKNWERIYPEGRGSYHGTECMGRGQPHALAAAQPTERAAARAHAGTWSVLPGRLDVVLDALQHELAVRKRALGRVR